jgi:GNAT superfamily N-acetyltransferase
MTDLTIRPLTAEQWPALEDLFGKTGASNGCWCMYWRIGPRYRSRPPADNKEDLARLAAAGSAGAARAGGTAGSAGTAPGLLAFEGGVAVGWCELAPRADLGWLARTRYLQPPDDLPVWSVPCFYVRRTHRGAGVTGALIAAAISAAAAAGAPALEAYPVDIAVPGHTGNLFPGIASTFARHGFGVVARHKPDRPVMRRPLTASAEADAAAAGPPRQRPGRRRR